MYYRSGGCPSGRLGKPRPLSDLRDSFCAVVVVVALRRMSEYSSPLDPADLVEFAVAKIARKGSLLIGHPVSRYRSFSHTWLEEEEKQ